jgi:spore coat protein A, manganese oxidase
MQPGAQAGAGAAAVRVSERSAGHHHVVPRPHPRDDPAQRVCGPSRVLPAAPGAGRPALRRPSRAPRFGDPSGTRHYEIPLAIQDRSFNDDGSLFYPDTREFFDDFQGPYIPDSDVPPIWNPEFFANTMVVNGRTWPVLEVEPRRYRFRLLNGCNSRFLLLKLASDLRSWPAATALPMWMIGAEGGFLPEPVALDQVLMAPAERADVIVDFTGLSVGTAIYMVNLGPDEPFGEPLPPGPPALFADRETTGQVMKFTVVPLASRDTSRPPDQLTLPAFRPLREASNTRQVSLSEQVSTVFDGPIAATLGTLNASGEPVPLGWSDPITENPALNAIEIWELHNFTEDAHPIHIHEVQFQVVDRQPFSGSARGPEPSERGLKTRSSPTLARSPA